jgi:quinol monooxygenase YgiN
MIIRLVKLTFQTSKVPDFIQLYESVKDKIAAFPGCLGVSLINDINKPDIFFTYSVWNSLEDLEKYRESPLFKKTWKQTKTFFSIPAEAWSLVQKGS